ncbi:EpsG family protein [Elizabethkingia sp. JS20170427COW]|uniref:EpsG family protein n=1 Tax=Elizabethkingia sp. JS20170427COW TaxID=2583851 RepID=UPI001110C2C8|nr:EpsG family protein [Elizabethkingia sp. JS20170427COW]QCX53676.1 hypothetical protein FGE20_08010 [Elizabethkingia sp. JS20170427COW]
MKKIKKGSFESLVLFCLSPILSIPVLIYNIFKGNTLSTKLLIIIFGLIGFLYVPTITNDKARYLDRYELFSKFTIHEFINFLAGIERPDFIFDISLYAFSYLNLPSQIFFFIVCTFSTYSIIHISTKLVSVNLSKEKKYGFIIFFILFSISLQTLFSGVRYYFGLSFLLWAIYYLILKKKTYKFILFFVLAICTHFSLIIFFPAFLAIIFFPQTNFRVLFIISLSFLILPKEVLGVLIENVSPTEAYSSKADQYLDNDLIGEGIKNNIANAIVFYTRQIWIYVAYIYLIFFKKKKENYDIILSLLFLIIFTVNLTFSVPTVFSRYSTFIKILFAVIIIKDFLKKKNINITYLFFLLYLISFILDIYLLRENLVESLFFKEIITSIGLLTKSVTIQDIIK